MEFSLKYNQQIILYLNHLMIPEVKYMIHKQGLQRNLEDYPIYKWLK